MDNNESVDFNINDNLIQNKKFVLFYSENKQAFYIQDTLNHNSLFLKVADKLRIQKDMIFNISNFPFLISSYQNNSTDFILKITQIKDNKLEKYWEFSSQTNRIITLGREKNNHINILESCISKLHCRYVQNYNNSFKFDDDNWCIYDGFLNKSSSRNGVWYALLFTIGYCSIRK